MPQNEYIELHRKRFGRQYDFEYRKRKRTLRAWKKRAKLATKLHGRRAKLFTNKRYKQKIELKKKDCNAQ